MDPILDGLNAAQLAAVTSPSDILQILAPPGSGKTKTLTSRVAYLLSRHGYKPWNILCLTFTVKSAQEMRQRIAKLLGNGLESKLILGTFHSVCRRYLRSYGHLIGLDKEFGIADTSDSKAIIKRIIERLKLNIDVKKAQPRISILKSKGIRSFDFMRERAKSKHVDQEEFATVFEEYEAQLKTSNLLDYDDLLLYCADLLREHPNCVANVEAVLIDEFQDTNVVQFDLMKLFAVSRNRITTVGDPDQSIYGWRSAEIKNLGRMQAQYPDTLVIHLENNYRSSAAILLAASEVIEQDNSRPIRPILPTHCPCTVPVLRKLPTADIEARWIVSEIQRSMGMTGDLLQLVDFAILLRSASLSRQIESAMGKAGIPYRMVGGKKFFERTEIKTLLDYLQVVSQPHSSDALSRIINVPSRHIGVTTVKSMLEEADAKKCSLWDLLRRTAQGHFTPKTKISKQAEKNMGTFVKLILTTRNKLLDLENPYFPEDILGLIIKKLEYRAYLEKFYGTDHEGRWANVEELLVQASDYNSSNDEHTNWGANDDNLPQIEGLEQGKGNPGEEALSKFLANILLATEIQRGDIGSTEGDMPQSQVTISTIHAAKGLEWPVVFIPSAYEGSIPHSRAEDTNEERRLLYVAMTRAQALLYISCPLRNSQKEDTKMSPFLLPKNVAKCLAAQGPAFTTDTVHDISLILRRGSPSESAILGGRRTLESFEDNLWPLNGERDPEEMETKWDKGAGNSISTYKRRRTDDEQKGDRLSDFPNATRSSVMVSIGTTTTMQSSSAFSYQGSDSFISASTHLQYVRENFQERRSKVSTETAKPTVKPLIESQEYDRFAKSFKRTKSSEGQGSILNFWALETNGNRLTDRPNIHVQRNVHHQRNRKRKSEDFQIEQENLPITTIEITDTAISKSRAVIPPELTDHKLRPAVNASRPRPAKTEHNQIANPYIFLSSSPLRCEDSHPRTDPSDPAPPFDLTSNVPSTRVGDGIGRKTIDTRPATTLHTTTVDQVRITGSNVATKKTLGVRRSMAGWSARKNQGFSVPSRRPDMQP